MRIPPALAAAPPPGPDAIAAACAHRALEPGRYALYTGNLDGYQELATLAAAAARTPLPVIVATHADASAPAPLRTIRRVSADEARLLTHGAAVTVLARRAAGGFPMKLLNYMEAARPTIALAGVADPLVHGESGWLLADDATPDAWADAIGRVAADPACAARLGAAARRTLERDHDPTRAAARLLGLLADLV